MLKLHKVIVQVVLVEESDGEVIGEQVANPVELFGVSRLREFAETLPVEIDKANEQRAGALNGAAR
jgi:hypothetical protein